MMAKEQEYNQKRGPRVIGAEDFREYANQIR